MSEGWKCPVCGRGVAPEKRTCDHGGLVSGPAAPWASPPLWQPWKRVSFGSCPACEKSGVCGCYRPERDSPIANGILSFGA